MSRQPAQMRNKTSYETTEMYEQVEPIQPGRPQHQRENRYVDPGFPSQPAVESTTPSVSISQTKKGKLFLISLSVVLLISLLLVSLIAVVLYSPLIRGQATDNVSLLARMQQLEERNEQLESRVEQLQAIQGTNYTVGTLSSLQEKQDSMETSIEQLSTTTTSQLASINNNIQSLSSTVNTMGTAVNNIGSVQTNIREDLDTLRSVDLYQNCITETRGCTISALSNYYWRDCSTNGLPITPSDTQYWVSDMRCEYESSYGYFESATLRRSGNNVYCWCDVTRFSSGTSSSHSTLSSAFTATCRLTVTRCPRSVNLIN